MDTLHPLWGRVSTPLAEVFSYRFGSLLERSAIQVQIDGSGGVDGLVPEMRLDHGQRDAGGDHPRRAAMPQIVWSRFAL